MTSLWENSASAKSLFLNNMAAFLEKPCSFIVFYRTVNNNVFSSMGPETSFPPPHDLCLLFCRGAKS